MLIPIGHDQNEVRQWPFATLAIIGLCFLIHADLAPQQAHHESAQATLEEQIVQLLVRCPTIALEEELIVPGLVWPDHLDRRIEKDRAAISVGSPVCESEGQARGRLYELVRDQNELLGNGPILRLGFVPVEGGLGPMVTSAFVHADWSHVFFNMLFLFLFAFPLENRWGRLPFLVFYLLAIVAESHVLARYSPHPYASHYGASGAVSATMGAFLVLFARTKLRLLFLGWPAAGFVFRVPAWLIIAFWTGKDALAAVAVQVTGTSDGIAHWSHLGGTGFGAFFALALVWTGADRRLRQTFGDDVDSAEYASIERALLHEELGQRQVSWELLRSALEKQPRSFDHALAIWLLEEGRPRATEAAALAFPAIEQELKKGDSYSAIALLEELQRAFPQGLPLSPARLGRLVRALAPHRAWGVVEPLLLEAIERAEAMPAATMVRLARVATEFDGDLARRLARAAVDSSPPPAPYLLAQLERFSSSRPVGREPRPLPSRPVTA